MSMPDATGGEMRGSRAGLCDTCEHQQLVHNTRGSTFSLCRRSREDPDYPRYPRIPVLECPGYGRREQPPDGG
ncbi:MAG TPA: hypothetical protein VIH71_01070 [Solirubrobacteraceae bacterium]